MAAMVLMLGLQGCGGGSGGGGFFPPPAGGGNPVAPADPVTPVDTANLYVSPTGNDQNPGTQARPFATLKQAVLKAASDAQAGAVPPAGRTIFLDQGTHYLTSTVVLGPELSGTPGKPFVITAVPGMQPVLSGARKLAGLQWATTGNGVWTAATDGTDFDDLYIDGERQVRARYPNFQPRDPAGPRIFFNGSGAATDSARVANWKNPKGGYAHVMLNGEWGDIHYQIKGKKPDGTLDLGEGTGNYRMEQGPDWNVSFVENIFEELDAPQEWFHDVAARKLYFIPKTGVDPRTALRVEVSGGVDNGLVEQLIVLKGSEATPIHDVAIKGLTLTQTGNTFMKTTEPLLRSDWKVFRGGAIYIEGGKDLEVAGNDMHALGGNAVFVSGYNRGIAVRGNEIQDIGASAILFVGSPEAVRSPGFHYAARTSYTDMDKTVGPKTNAYPAQSIAENNLIHDIGFREKQATGVEISMASEITVRSNSIYGTPRAGINIGDGTWGGHVLEYNDVFDTVLETGDHGAFNSWGRDRYWGQLPAGNGGVANLDLAANPLMPFLDAMKPVTIRNNRFRCDHGWDIDLDDGSTNYVIENNVLLKGGLKNREGFKRINRNNILVNSTFHAHVWFANSLDHFEHNIVMGAYQPIGINSGNKGELVDNNLLPTSAALQAAQAMGWDANSKYSGDPMFADGAKGDFTVAASSPALTVGFQNIAMDKFGVQDPRLKPKAQKPIFDPLNIQVVTLETPSDFLGAKVKSVETEGERSAGGLPSVAGVLVQSVLAGSDAANSGVLANDVFLQATVAGQAKNIVDSNDLNAALGAEAANGKLHVKVQRNNLPVEFDLLFPSSAVHNDDWSGIVYTGNWGSSTGRSQSSGDFNFDIHYTQTNGDAMSVTFTGTGIRALAPVDTTAVQFSASLDGAAAQNITIPAVAVYKGQRTAYSVSGLATGSHTLVLKKVSGAYFQLDRVDVTK
ncbi:PDZ domain-containing protein [Variovorax sp. PAMC26660]|uniref:PDZ domain-containing protein n=1 Tax=Variovorax sp. PAMC26660 TaxID=2762322 RepID=UPI00164D43D9|nr:PDZ domain-containing protein [Variovorax sp. PAMC26660]QNK65389.1 right-handed parallel beta-helix repeat-containing protein [Variovorax sp. PAMC26660]